MKTLEWKAEDTAAAQLSSWSRTAAEPGLLHVRFSGIDQRAGLDWGLLEPWTRSRAVTVAEVCSSISGPALDVALCCDLVYLHKGVELVQPEGRPSAGFLWALGRAGRAALARGLLDPRPIAESEAVQLGIAQRVLGVGESPLVKDDVSLTALSSARDLMRSSARARSSLELATFRLLFASGDPGEGASAFFERRSPDFSD